MNRVGGNFLFAIHPEILASRKYGAFASTRQFSYWSFSFLRFLQLQHDLQEKL